MKQPKPIGCTSDLKEGDYLYTAVLLEATL